MLCLSLSLLLYTFHIWPYFQGFSYALNLDIPYCFWMCEKYLPHRVDPLVDEQEPLSLYYGPFLI